MDETELRLTDGVHLVAELWRNDGLQVIRLEPETGADSALGGSTKLRGRNDDARVELTLEPKRHGYAYTIELRADKPTRVRLRLTTGPTGNAFHLIPAAFSVIPHRRRLPRGKRPFRRIPGESSRAWHENAYGVRRQFPARHGGES